MFQASNITSVIWDFYKCHMGFITPAQTNQISAFVTTRIYISILYSTTSFGNGDDQ